MACVCRGEGPAAAEGVSALGRDLPAGERLATRVPPAPVYDGSSSKCGPEALSVPTWGSPATSVTFTLRPRAGPPLPDPITGICCTWKAPGASGVPVDTMLGPGSLPRVQVSGSSLRGGLEPLGQRCVGVSSQSCHPSPGPVPHTGLFPESPVQTNLAPTGHRRRRPDRCAVC